LACAGLALSCGRDARSSRAESDAPAPASAAPSATAAAPKIPAPSRLAQLALSAYATSLAIDDEAVYLMTRDAVYRLVEGEAAHGRRLPLGTGPTLTRSAFVFWSDGSIWSAPKNGGEARELAKFPHEPQYFVSSGESLAWVDQTEQGEYTIYTLDGKKPRALVSSRGELRGLDMVGEAVYFVQRTDDGAWRIGVVRLNGAPPEYTAARAGRTPSQLSGVDDIYYFDLDQSRIVKLSLDLRHEETHLGSVVCSPVHVSERIFCGCVEGLFDVSKSTRQPRVLAPDRAGSITSVISNAKRVAWTVDLGTDQLAVDTLPASAFEGQP